MRHRLAEQLGDACLNSSEFDAPAPKGMDLTGKGVMAIVASRCFALPCFARASPDTTAKGLLWPKSAVHKVSKKYLGE
jgi:hypothetical protein